MVVGLITVFAFKLRASNHAMRTKLRRLEIERRDLVRLVNYDDLTSAHSRHFVRSLFQNELQDGRNSIMFIDLDNFKSVNDGYGHKVGDTLLRAIANALQSAALPNEVVFRVGGDEFAIYMRRTGIEEGLLRARAINEIVASVSIVADGVPITRTASIGVATIDAGQDFAGALYYADEAQYSAKSSGGNTSLANTGDTLRTMIARRTGPRVEDVARALERDEVTYFVQPIFDTLNNRPVGVEALLRWQRNDGRLFLPDQFIDVLTDRNATRLAPPFEKANRIARSFTGGDLDLFFSFNISAGMLDYDDSDFHDLCQKHLVGLEPSNVVFEIVESAMIRDVAKARHFLQVLRDKGVRVALDDFGTGFSNLERLQELNVDIVKIDRRFVRGIEQGGVDTGILRALYELAIAMDFDIIAEGIESPAELEALHAIGIYHGQGYLLGRPARAEFWLKEFGLGQQQATSALAGASR